MISAKSAGVAVFTACVRCRFESRADNVRTSRCYSTHRINFAPKCRTNLVLEPFCCVATQKGRFPDVCQQLTQSLLVLALSSDARQQSRNLGTDNGLKLTQRHEELVQLLFCAGKHIECPR